MPTPQEEQAVTGFEIDNPAEFGPFFLKSRREVIFYLQLLVRQHSIVTAYLDDGQHFFLSSLLAIDEAKNQVFLDPSSVADNNAIALAAKQITLVANLDRIKMQVRLPALTRGRHQDQEALCAPIPELICRLQRREFFRLESPHNPPTSCKLQTRREDGSSHNLELPLSDISGGGLSLIGATDMVADFPRDALFQDCRLEIPGEGVIQVNLRVRKTVEISDLDGEHNLRIGCEFVNLPSSRLAFIERYIARIERERKARDSGLLDH